MPVGKTEMGFIDNHCKDVGILDIPGRRVAGLQALMMKEELHLPSNATQSLLFTFHLK